MPSKSLDKLIGNQIPDKSRKGVGFVSYNAVPPLPTGLFSPPKFDLSNSGLEEFQQPEFEGYGPKPSKSFKAQAPISPYKPLSKHTFSEDTSNEVRESPDAPLIEELVSDDKSSTKSKIKGYVDSGCSRHMTGNMSYLSDFKELDEEFFVGYSLNSKAFRVYNIRTSKVEENLHIRFLEDKPIITGDGPKWLFDIDDLTKSMNMCQLLHDKTRMIL
ncbi:hypothetical protein Tco_0032759 [Tanacetum coccineum]